MTYWTEFFPNEDAAGIKGTAAGAGITQTASIQIFKRSDTPLSKPADTPQTDATYIYATATIEGLDNGWEYGIPAGTGDIYTSFTAFSSPDATFTIAPEDWSDPVLWVESVESPIIIDLTNDAVVVPSEEDGSNPNLSIAVTEVFVFEGQIDVTNLWTITPSPSVGITATFIDNVYTVTGLTEDVGLVEFIATRAGYPTQTAVFTISKGKKGLDAVVYSVKTATAAIRRDGSGDYSPEYLEIRGFQHSGADGREPYSGRFKVYTSDDDTSTFDLEYTSNSDQQFYSFVLPPNKTHILVELYEAGGTSNLLDSEIVPIVGDGVGTVNIDLSNQNVTVPANSDGSNPVLTDAVTEITVYEGLVDTTDQWVLSASPTVNITGSLVNNIYTVTGFTGDNGKVTFTATRSGYASRSAVFTISKTKAGEDGVSPAIYSLEPDFSAIKQLNSGSFLPPSIKFSAYIKEGENEKLPYDGRIRIQTSDGGITWNTVYTSSSNENNKSYTIPDNITHIRGQLYKAGGTSVLLDFEAVPIVEDGVDGIDPIVVNLTNDSTAFPANASGVVSDYSMGVTTISIYEGGTDVTALWNISPVKVGGVISGNYNSGTFTYSVTNFSSALSTGKVTFNLTRSGYASRTIDFTIGKVKDGQAGNYQFLQTSIGVAKKKVSDFQPDDVTITAYEFDPQGGRIAYNGRIRIKASTDNGATYPHTLYSSASNQSSYTYTFVSTVSGAEISAFKIELYKAGGFVELLDSEIIPVVSDGKSAVFMFALKEYMVFPANSDGVVQQYADPFNYNSISVLADGNSGVGNHFNFAVVSNPQGIQLTLDETSNPYLCQITITGGFDDPNEDFALIVIEATGTGDYAGVQIQKSFLLGKYNIDYNTDNNDNSDPIIDPSFNNDGSDLVIGPSRQTGSHSGTITWEWSGDEGDIDGFMVTLMEMPTGAVYTPGSLDAEEVEYYTKPDRRSYKFFNLYDNRYYTFFVRAYRGVSSSISPTGFLYSNPVKITAAGQNPYSFSGAGDANITAKIADIPAGDIAGTYEDFYSDNNQNDTTPLTPYSISCASVIREDSTADVTVSWAYSNSTDITSSSNIDGFVIGLYKRTSSSSWTYGIENNNAYNSFIDWVWLDRDARTTTFQGCRPSEYHWAVVIAYRRVSKKVETKGLLKSVPGQSGSAHRPSSSTNFTGNVSGTPASIIGPGAEAASNGLNSSGTVKPNKVTTVSIVANGVTSLTNYTDYSTINLSSSYQDIIDVNFSTSASNLILLTATFQYYMVCSSSTSSNFGMNFSFIGNFTSGYQSWTRRHSRQGDNTNSTDTQYGSISFEYLLDVGLSGQNLTIRANKLTSTGTCQIIDRSLNILELKK